MSFCYALGGVDLVAPVWHVALLELLLDDDLDLVPRFDPRLQVVGLLDAFPVESSFPFGSLFTLRSASSAWCD